MSRNSRATMDLRVPLVDGGDAEPLQFAELEVVADCGGGDLAERAELLDVGRVAHVAQELETALANE